jgi:hypothetical protein
MKRCYRVITASLLRRYRIGSKPRMALARHALGVDELEQNTPQAFSRGTQGYPRGYSGLLSRVPTWALRATFTVTQGYSRGTQEYSRAGVNELERNTPQAFSHFTYEVRPAVAHPASTP